jgi:hypothetical protein
VGWPDEACEGRDFWPWDAEAGADEFVERQLQLHAGFGERQHDVASPAAELSLFETRGCCSQPIERLEEKIAQVIKQTDTVSNLGVAPGL